MHEIKFELPYPPSANHYYKFKRTWNGVKGYISKKGEQFREEVNSVVIIDKHKRGLDLRAPYFVNERLAVKIILFPPDRRIRDIDNICKPVLDSLQYGEVFTNDNQVDSLYIQRQGVLEGGKMFVTITVLTLLR